MNRKKGLSTASLAKFFLTAWPLRFAGAMLACATLAVAFAGSAADSLRLSPEQKANSALGAADGRIQLPGTAPIGSDGTILDEQLRAAIAAVGGGAPSVDYLAAGLRPDGGDEASVRIEEIQRPQSVAPRVTLLSGKWPVEVGQALVSTELADTWPVGGTVHFFNGSLDLHIVGTFRDLYHSDSRTFIVPSGTWSSLHTIDDDKSSQLDTSAGRIVRWSGHDSTDAIKAAVTKIVSDDPLASGVFDSSSGVEAETRVKIETQPASINITMLLAAVAGPIIAGVIAGLIAGGFTARTRKIMWTIGVPFAATRNAATLSVLMASAAGAIVGSLLGMVLGWGARPMLASIATQELGPVSNAPAALVAVPLGVAGALVGAALLRKRSRRQRYEPSKSNERTWDAILFRITGAVVLGSFGTFIGTGTADLTKISLATLLIALAIIVAFVPFAVQAVGKLTPSSFASLLACRKFSSDRAIASVTVIAIASLQILGFALAITVSSTIAQINASTESYVPAGQIVFEPPADAQIDTDSARTDFEEALGLSDPVLVLTVGAGSERGDGPTRVVADVAALERVIAQELSPEHASLLRNGGALLTKPLDGDTVSFPATDGFPGATFSAASISGLDPSFLNINGFLLTQAAEAAKMPLLVPSYVYTTVTPEQVLDAKRAVVELDLNPDWVKVYLAPDEFAAPLQVSAITVLVSLVAGFVLLATSTSQARQMRPDLAGLSAIGMSGRFLATVVAIRAGLTFVIATVSALVSSIIGVVWAYSLANLTTPVALPVLPMVAMIGSLVIFTVIASAVSTRRLRNSEWIDT